MFFSVFALRRLLFVLTFEIKQSADPKSGKARKPKHQNKFAFRHNKNSKLTKKILERPNQGLCLRCYDQIEWRKKYRKYKLLSAPGKW